MYKRGIIFHTNHKIKNNFFCNNIYLYEETIHFNIETKDLWHISDNMVLSPQQSYQ